VNGARALLRTLVDSGVTTCFANPGTSEMHFVAALDDVPELRPVLCLFEGVATGAADGYARMTGVPACTLLHLGPGLGNGIANLHNARRARTPIVNVVGDHATTHLALDAPLTSDIDALSSNVSVWTRTPQTVAEVPGLGAAAVAAALGPPSGVATLVLPADLAWSDGAEPAPPARLATREAVTPERIEDVAALLHRGEPVALLLGGDALGAVALRDAGRIATATGATLLHETFPARMARGAGLPAPERVQYLGEMAVAQLGLFRHVVLVGALDPVAFFAYPDKPGRLVPPGTELHLLAAPGEDAALALEALAGELAASADAPAPSSLDLGAPTGELEPGNLAAALATTLPDGAIVADEGNTGGLFFGPCTAGGPAHDWLTLTGGAIGIGMPLAVGAAVAAPDRPVLNLQADGSAMYTPSALWTMAREGLDVTTVIVDNGSYAILNMELSRVGAGEPGPRARSLLDLHDPSLDFVALATGMGVPAERATTGEELVAALQRAYAEPGPHLIDAVVGRRTA
jgi:acetolactate synthase-1/2/3 large subunit